MSSSERLKHLVQSAFRTAGFEVSRLSRTPRKTFLGLRDLGIKTVLDIGGNVGQFARRAAAVLPDAHIYSFEPLSGPFSELSRWAAQAYPDRIKAFNIAIGDRNGTFPMFEHTDFSVSSSLLATTVLTQELYPDSQRQQITMVPLRRLDDFVREQSIELISKTLVKMDLQGYEAHAVAGSTETLRRSDACILEVCYDPLFNGQATFKELLNMLDALGYRFVGNLEQFCAEDGHVIFADALFVK